MRNRRVTGWLTTCCLCLLLACGFLLGADRLPYLYEGDPPMPRDDEHLQRLHEKYADRIVSGVGWEANGPGRTAMNQLMAEWNPVGHTLAELEYVVGHRSRSVSLIYHFGTGRVWLVGLSRRSDEETPRFVAHVRSPETTHFADRYGPPPGPCDAPEPVPDASVFDRAPEGVRELVRYWRATGDPRAEHPRADLDAPPENVRRLLRDRHAQYAGRIRSHAWDDGAQESCQAMEELSRAFSQLPEEVTFAERNYLRRLPIEVWLALAGAPPNGALVGYGFSDGFGGTTWGFQLHCGRIAHVYGGHGFSIRPVEVGPEETSLR